MLLACVLDSLQLHQVIDHPQVADAVVCLAHGERWVCLQSAAEEMHVAVTDSTNLLVVMLVVVDAGGVVAVVVIAIARAADLHPLIECNLCMSV